MSSNSFFGSSSAIIPAGGGAPPSYVFTPPGGAGPATFVPNITNFVLDPVGQEVNLNFNVTSIGAAHSILAGQTRLAFTFNVTNAGNAVVLPPPTDNCVITITGVNVGVGSSNLAAAPTNTLGTHSATWTLVPASGSTPAKSLLTITLGAIKANAANTASMAAGTQYVVLTTLIGPTSNPLVGAGWGINTESWQFVA